MHEHNGGGRSSQNGPNFALGLTIWFGDRLTFDLHVDDLHSEDRLRKVATKLIIVASSVWKPLTKSDLVMKSARRGRREAS